jgi:hypothetical protein
VSGPEFDPTHEVEAPVGAVGWSTSRGWLLDEEDAASTAVDDVVYRPDPSGIVRGLSTTASLAVIALADRRLLSVRREVDELRIRLGQAAEAAADLFAEGSP